MEAPRGQHSSSRAGGGEDSCFLSFLPCMFGPHVGHGACGRLVGVCVVCPFPGPSPFPLPLSLFSSLFPQAFILKFQQCHAALNDNKNWSSTNTHRGPMPANHSQPSPPLTERCFPNLPERLLVTHDHEHSTPTKATVFSCMPFTADILIMCNIQQS